MFNLTSMWRMSVESKEQVRFFVRNYCGINVMTVQIEEHRYERF